jgi:hypothetical protein
MRSIRMRSADTLSAHKRTKFVNRLKGSARVNSLCYVCVASAAGGSFTLLGRQKIRIK